CYWFTPHPSLHSDFLPPPLRPLFPYTTLFRSARPPLFLISSTKLFPAVSFRSAMATAAPSRAKSSAVARPIPEAPPVMRAVLACRRICIYEAPHCTAQRNSPARQTPGGLRAIYRVHVTSHIRRVI